MKRWIGALLALSCAFGWAGAAIGEEPSVTAFCYMQGAHPGATYEFTVHTPGPGEVSVAMFGQNLVGEALDLCLQVDEAVFAEVGRIVTEYDLRAWDGFDETEPGVIGGHHFYLEVFFSDGTQIAAGGYMRYPENYAEADAAIMAYFLPWGKGDGE